MKKKVFIVIDKNGRGWDSKIGGTLYPRTFVTAESARQEARAVDAKFNVNTIIQVAHLIYKNPSKS